MMQPIAGFPSAAELESMAFAAMAKLPEPFAGFVRDLVVRVEEFADEESLGAVGLENPWELTGLYHGRPLDQRSIWDAGDMPAVITLFRSPLLSEWRHTGVGLGDLVRHVIVHEVGHHFGLSDADMEAIETER